MSVFKYRFNLKKVVLYCIFQIVLACIVIPALVFYGPFSNIRNMWVESAMTTSSHQFLATLFLPEQKIKSIMDKTNSIIFGNSNPNLLNFVNHHDNTIELFEVKSKYFVGKVMLIKDPTRVKVGISRLLPNEGQTVSQIAQENNAVAAINAGGFLGLENGSWSATGGVPEGIIIHDGKIYYSDFVNDKIKRDIVGFDAEGRLIVGKFNLKEIKAMDIREAVSFGPPLIVNGQPMIKSGDGGWGIAPRTAIGQKPDGTVIFLTIDGRALESVGATLRDVQDIMLKYGAYNAANLDGGSSTTMYYKGRVINNPSNPLGERTVPTVFMVK
ncbi:Exopolysaccharide biosynthesis protein [Thermodesulfobium acidiphilum]|uniref:Exopolysaccharide biosynthesis protein n=1 Tax=Thermodesulfobium acidiphilum TaxID=1794699 RepID=A0A2R4W0A1_THEAF|nr:Exopolysaccharide biosynthesis protein [Thermodesulfobium acidiphilum]